MKAASEFDLAVLRNISLFSMLNDQQLQDVQRVIMARSYPKGQVLFHQGDPGNCLYLLTAGRLRIFVSSPDGREATVRMYGPGSSVGELAVLDGKPRSASAIAIDTLKTMVLYREDFLKLLHEHISITESVLAMLAERVRYTTHYSEQLMFLSAPGRIAKTLLQLAAIESDLSRPARLELSQQELANFAGTTREWGNRALQEFAAAGLVAIERRAILVLDRVGLEKRVC